MSRQREVWGTRTQPNLSRASPGANASEKRGRVEPEVRESPWSGESFLANRMCEIFYIQGGRVQKTEDAPLFVLRTPLVPALPHSRTPAQPRGKLRYDARLWNISTFLCREVNNCFVTAGKCIQVLNVCVLLKQHIILMLFRNISLTNSAMTNNIVYRKNKYF